ncbi:DUF6194 family protein [Nocardia sp. NBC_00511]|uniref:DUF6194 family protein n=1 Tax=Nocardia sp. NBC_00511 TaxID=2903591 RepID=UPI0030DEA9AF
MSIDEIIEFIEALGGVLTLRPGPGDGFPEIAWGDVFFYYSPSGEIPTATQPFATIVTKDYPDDRASRLDRPDAFRLNISAGREAFAEQTGYTPREAADHPVDSSRADVLLAHPVYAGAAWLAVVNPGPGTARAVEGLLVAAHSRARGRFETAEGCV